MDSKQHTFLPDPAGLWGLTLFIILTGIGGAKALRDGDTLWHIRMGQEMIERGEILKTDLFSHTVYGQPWHAHEWLWEVIMAALHDWAGLAGVVITSLAVVGLTFTIIFKVAAKFAGDGPSSLAMASALPYVYIHLLARPHLFTWLGAALTLYLLERGGRWPWLLVPLTAIWANLHGGVLFGLVLQTIFLAGYFLDNFQRNIPRWLKDCWTESSTALLVLFACVVAACINPFGYQIFLFPFKVAAPVFTQSISEWKAPDFQELWFAKPWIIGIVLMMLWSGKKFPWRWNLLVLFLLWQTLGHVRNLSIAALLLIPCFAMFFRDLASCINLPTRKAAVERVELTLSAWSGPLLTVVLAILLFGLIAANFAGARNLADRRFPPAKENLEAVVNFLDKGYPPGNLLNDYEWGDYLIYAMKSPPKVFIDGRADMYGEEVFSDHGKILGMDKEVDKLLEKYSIGWALLLRDNLLGRYLLDCRGWRSIYTDEHIVVLSVNK